jgi:hypothetical protein
MLTAKTHQVSGSSIVLAAGLYALAVGEAVFLLAALILPPTAVQNDATFLCMACWEWSLSSPGRFWSRVG